MPLVMHAHVFGEIKKQLPAEEMVDIGVVGQVVQITILICECVFSETSQNGIVLGTGIMNELHEFRLQLKQMRPTICT